VHYARAKGRKTSQKWEILRLLKTKIIKTKEKEWKNLVKRNEIGQ